MAFSSYRGAPASTHSVLGLAPLVELAAERGVPRRRLLAGTGITAAQLDDPHAQVPLAREMALVQNLVAAVPDPRLPVVAGRRYHLSIFGLLGSVVAAAPTVREVVRLFVEHLHLTYTPFAVHAFEDAREARLVFLDQCDLGDLRRFYLLRDVSFTVSVAEQLLPGDAGRAIREVAFDFDGDAALRELFRAPVAFGRDVTGVALDVSFDRARPDGNALALRVLEEHLEAFGRRTGDSDTVARVRLEITIAVAARREIPDEEAIASALGVSGRTVRRHLDEAGTSFRALADDVLRAAASRYLRDSSLDVAAIAERLGYAEPASFIRAFRRWTGETPVAHRRRLRGGR